MIEDQIEAIVRKVIREELALRSDPDDIALLTADEVARMLNFKDRHAVYKLKREKKLTGINLGRTLRFSRAEIRRFINERVG
jgi:excisionase family DNA binding protein